MRAWARVLSVEEKAAMMVICERRWRRSSSATSEEALRLVETTHKRNLMKLL